MYLISEERSRERNANKYKDFYSSFYHCIHYLYRDCHYYHYQYNATVNVNNKGNYCYHYLLAVPVAKRIQNLQEYIYENVLSKLCFHIYIHICHLHVL